MEPEYGGRNWDYDGSNHIFSFAGTGTGYTVFRAAVEYINQQILDIEPYGRLYNRSISIGVLFRGIVMSVIWILLPLALGAAHFRKTDIG